MILLMAFKLKTEDISLTRITRTLYIFIGFFAISIIIFDSGNLITRESVVDRWSLLSALFIANTVAWFVGSKPSKKSKSLLTYMLSISLIAFAGFMTYWERGMASSSTIFYILPLLVIGTLKDRHALMAVAGLSGGTYAFSAVKYFNDFFNEGYRVQLWGNIVIYTGTILVSAWLLLIVLGLRKDSK
jgi:hypothetical protein